MNLPRISFIAPGPAAPDRSLAAAAAPALSTASLGRALGDASERGFKIAEQIRQTDEAGKRTEFLAQAEKEAADFNNGLLTRSDFDKWGPDYQKMAAGWKDRATQLGLSPEGRTILESQLLDFTSKRGLQIETNAALRTVEEGRAKVALSMRNHVDLGDEDGVERDIAEMERLGATPTEVEEARQRATQGINLADLTRLVEESPDQYTEIIPEQFPWLKDKDRRQLENMAQNLKQEYRATEQENLEGRLGAPDFDEAEIDRARYLTEADKNDFKRGLRNVTPPTPEQRNAAWTATDKLRGLRDDPTVSQQQYREVYNDTRAAVLSTIPPSYQGDLKKELNYLSPAGRDPSNPKGQGSVTAEDINAEGRAQIRRALGANQFGNVGEDANPKEKEEAYRKAGALEIETKRFIGSLKVVDGTALDQVRAFIDGKVSGKRTGNNTRNLAPSVPGLGGPLRGRSAVPFGQLPPTSSIETDGMVLPPKQPAQQLNDYLDGNR